MISLPANRPTSSSPLAEYKHFTFQPKGLNIVVLTIDPHMQLAAVPINGTDANLGNNLHELIVPLDHIICETLHCYKT